MLLERPDAPVIKPVNASPPKEPALKLPAPGTMVFDAPCRFRHEPVSGWFVLDFLDTKPAEPVAPAEQAAPAKIVCTPKVLPSRWLQKLQEISAEEPRAVFQVTGEMTVYKKHPYIFIHSVTIRSENPQPRPQPSPAAGETVSATAPAEARGQTSATADTIISRLMRDRPGRPVILPIQPLGRARPEKSVAPAVMERPSVERGRMVVDRRVRVLPEQAAGWWEARFESDNTLLEPPIRLLPCVKLAGAERIAAASGGGLRVSGVITHYRGRAYLLLRKVLPAREMGQF